MTTRKYKNSRNNKTVKRSFNHKHRQNVIQQFLEILNCVKIYHWSTGSYSQHRATDMLYEQLNKRIDEFVEIMLGKTKERIRTIKTSSCSVPNKKSFIKKMKKFRGFLYDLNNIMHPVNDSNLYNIRDEMLGVVDQLLYLFQLK